MALGETFELGGGTQWIRKTMEFSYCPSCYLHGRIVDSLIFLVYICKVLQLLPYFGTKDLFNYRTYWGNVQ